MSRKRDCKYCLAFEGCGGGVASTTRPLHCGAFALRSEARRLLAGHDVLVRAREGDPSTDPLCTGRPGYGELEALYRASCRMLAEVTGERDAAEAELRALKQWSCVACGARFSTPVPDLTLDGVTHCTSCYMKKQLSLRVAELEARMRPLSSKHTGMRVNIEGALRRIRSGGDGADFCLDELLKYLRLMAKEFYAGNIKIVDEFLQLYCLDGDRPKGGGS